MDTSQHRRPCPTFSIGSVSACTRAQQYALPDPQPSKHEALNQQHWPSNGATLTQRLLFSGSVEKPHCVLHIAGCEDKTVAQLIEPKDNLITVDVKNGIHHINIHSLYCPQD